MCKHLFEMDKSNKGSKKYVASKEVIQIFEKVDKMLQEFYTIFYKFDRQKIVDIGKKRKNLITELQKIIETSNKPMDRIIAHYMIVISQKIFCLIGPYLVLNV